jgi:hypothetical protein
MNQTFRKTTMMLAAGVLLGIGATAQTTTVAEGTTGSCAWVLTSDSVLTVTGSGAMADYYGNSAPWYHYYSRITSVAIEEGVTSIGARAFADCSVLTAVTIPSGVASIGEQAFFNCSVLTAVTIPSSVASIGDYAFNKCRGLTSIIIPSGVASIGGGAFYLCSGLASVACPSATPPAAGDYAFAYLPSGATLTVPCAGVYMMAAGGWCDIANIVSTESDCPAPGCHSFTSGALAVLRCPATGTLTVSGDGAMEDYGYSSAPWHPYRIRITSVAIEEGVASIGSYAFSDCSKLTAVTIPSSVASIGSYAFSNCSRLTAVTIPSSTTSIGDSAFYLCSSLASITNLCPVPQFIDAHTLYNVGRETCTLYVPEGSVEAYQAADVWKDFLHIEAVPTVVSVTVTVTPATVAVQKGATQQFALEGEVDPGAALPVAWSVAGSANSGTSISADGLLTVAADEAAATLKVIATATADITKADTATVTVTEGSSTAVEALRAAPLQAYPNPTTGLVYIDNPDGAEVEVYTLGGALVLCSRAAIVDLSQHAAGAYIIKVGSKAAKVVKE